MAPSKAPQERLREALADRYLIEGEIGSGGMATVYLAEDLKHHRKVAVKVLDPEPHHILPLGLGWAVSGSPDWALKSSLDQRGVP